MKKRNISNKREAVAYLRRVLGWSEFIRQHRLLAVAISILLAEQK